jgi:UDP-N-acetylglucosamine acyltransferase
LISPLAHIHPDAQIGVGVTISPFCYIDKDTIIGDYTWIAPNVTIFEGARIGQHCKIFSGAVIAAIPQDLKFSGEKTTAEIGDYTTIRECATIHRATEYAWQTVVGNHCLLMAYSHVAHDCALGNYVIMANAATLAGHVVIEDHAILEGLVAVQQFVRIGTHSFVAGGSLVRKNVPPYVKVAREPLTYMGINSIGLSRRGFSAETINHIHDIYRYLFVSGYSLSKAIAAIAALPISPEKEIILRFIEQSPKGIVKGIYPPHENGNGNGKGKIADTEIMADETFIEQLDQLLN